MLLKLLIFNKVYVKIVKQHAGVVKLADALDSKSCVRKYVSVQVRPSAPKGSRVNPGVFALWVEACGAFQFWGYPFWGAFQWVRSFGTRLRMQQKSS